MTLAIVIPAYNEAATIRNIVEALLKYSMQIVVIDDGSTDDTAKNIEELPITLLRNPQNAGKAASLMKGFHHCLTNENCTAIITLDADNQHNPKDIAKLISAHQQYPQALVIAARMINTHQAPGYRLLGNKIADFFISWAAGKAVIDTQSGYRLYPRALCEYACRKLALNSRFSFESEIIIDAAQMHCPIVAVAITTVYPNSARASHYHPLRDSWQIARMVIAKFLKSGSVIKKLRQRLSVPPIIL